MNMTMLATTTFTILAQQSGGGEGGGAYGAGQYAGYVFMAILAAAILWKVLKKKE